MVTVKAGQEGAGKLSAGSWDQPVRISERGEDMFGRQICQGLVMIAAATISLSRKDHGRRHKRAHAVGPAGQRLPANEAGKSVSA